jgi:hypothetical protein
MPVGIHVQDGRRVDLTPRDSSGAPLVAPDVGPCLRRANAPPTRRATDERVSEACYELGIRGAMISVPS